MIRSLLVFALLITATISFAQPGWKWPEDEDTAKEKQALYSDAVKAERYEAAIAPHQWLLDNAPDLNVSLYINGTKMYEELADKETDKAKKAEYVEKALSLYDDRIEYFKDEVNVLNRKSFAVYKYYKSQRDKYDVMYNVFEETVDKSGAELNTNLVVAYLDVVRRYNAAKKSLSDDDILNKYDKASEILAEKAAAGDDITKPKAMIDKLLTSMVTVDCEFIATKLAPKLKETPDDVGLAKKIMGLSLASNCGDLPEFLDAAKIVQENEPDFGIAKVIALRSAAKGDIEGAMKYFNQAVELATDDQKKADIYFEMAAQYSKQGRFSEARAQANKALAIDPGMSKAYKLIGDLYFNSFDRCKQGVSRVDDRAVYLIAYDMYQKAGNQSMMQQARAQFPSIGEIFELNMEEGSTINVGCWINGSTELRRRPE